MICKNCKAILGDRHPSDVTDYTNASCMIGYETVVDNKGMMLPVKKCPKPKSWKELKRLMEEIGEVKP